MACLKGGVEGGDLAFSRASPGVLRASEGQWSGRGREIPEAAVCAGAS